MSFSTRQEEFWAGEFGDEYIGRNDLTPTNQAMCLDKWIRILPHMPQPPASILEFGPNIGLNLRALHELIPDATLTGVEINAKAVEVLKQWNNAKVINESILDVSLSGQYDLVFTSGVLIHIKPEELPKVYEKMYTLSRRYIIMIEYFNPSPVEVCYRGHAERLFKRDFAGDIMNAYPDLRLNNYGFLYKRDNYFKHDNLNWFVMEKC